MNDKTAYPLCWPDKWPRTPRHEIAHSPFGRTVQNGQHSMEKVRRALQGELDRLDADGCSGGHVEISAARSTNLANATDAMAHAASDEQQRHRLAREVGGRQIKDRGSIPWADYRIIETTDGKARRIPVEPAFFPLADGFPDRVAVLKGFGNAIVPQVAAEFIKAYLETVDI